MSNETTTVIRIAPSGSIQLVWNGVFSRVEFDCDCLDALKYCHGMCCTRRAGFSVVLEEQELESYQHKNGVLAAKPDGMSCFYLTEEGKCGIHETRPKMCRQWHCSPGGSRIDTEIVRRDAGWMLTSIRKEEAEFVQLVRSKR